MEIGKTSFGDTLMDESGEYGPTSEAITNLLEAIQLADKAGLDFFGVGEHHTKYIKLGSAASIISTDDPVRVYQQFATAAIISKGRIEVTAGRGSNGIIPVIRLQPSRL